MKKFFCPILLLLTLCCRAALVQFSWTASLDPNVTNYRLYAWTNSPPANCQTTNAAQVATLGNVTNASLTLLVPAQYTFAVTALVTNVTQTNESDLSSFALLDFPSPPTYFITVQSSTNLVQWNTTPIFFRLQITNGP